MSYFVGKNSYRIIWLIPMLFLVCAFTAGQVLAANLVVADFDTGEKPNNLGGDFGAWDKDPDDPTQSCEISFDETQDALGDEYGQALKITYDVDSPNPAYNGFWMKLNEQDATAFDALSFFIKGDNEAGFTSRLKIELKDQSNNASPYLLSGITEEWQLVKIPFEKFRKIEDWSALSEVVVVFDDINADDKDGVILIDHITFTNL